MNAPRWPLTRGQVIYFDPPTDDGLYEIRPWQSDDGLNVGWLWLYLDGSRRFDYLNMLDGRTTRYRGDFGLPQADDET